MNDSLVKLEDFQLDEISGGITAKQVGKKIGAYAIKGTCTLVSGVIDFELLCNMSKVMTGLLMPSLITTFPLSGVAGWKIGELICKKIGLED